MQVQADKDTMQRFNEDMIRRFWRFKRLRFPTDNPRFEEARPRGLRPPVFHEADAESNLLIDPVLTEVERLRLIGMIPVLKRHQWFRSMSSSQALTSQEAREKRIVGSLKPFRWNPAGNQSRPVEPDQQPEASLAWWVGDHPCEA